MVACTAAAAQQKELPPHIEQQPGLPDVRHTPKHAAQRAGDGAHQCRPSACPPLSAPPPPPPPRRTSRREQQTTPPRPRPGAPAARCPPAAARRSGRGCVVAAGNEAGAPEAGQGAPPSERCGVPRPCSWPHARLWTPPARHPGRLSACLALTSMGLIFSPPRLISSLRRPVSVRYPSSSSIPWSPVWNQPPAGHGRVDARGRACRCVLCV